MLYQTRIGFWDIPSVYCCTWNKVSEKGILATSVTNLHE